MKRRTLVERHYDLRKGKKLELGKRTLIMGILNVTPDSFSDGGRWVEIEEALAHARQMEAEGADIIDIGAESSRPGFVPMPAEEEIARLTPYLKALSAECRLPISVDTFKAETAEAALEMGADILNDIWGLQYREEPGEMAKVAAQYQVPVIAMHNQKGTDYQAYEGDVIAAERDFFRRTIEIAEAAGLPRELLILDPGVGFGKTVEDNLMVMNRQEELTEIDGFAYPLLLGTSRKSVIGKTLDLPVDERLEGTLATSVIGALKGADIVRVHDVKENLRAIRMAEAIING
ncbi:dihydropteroate synthase [Selenomonas sp. AB3002]|uniref:dihydropteroate synthase n=1 Tax=Selenomonas sp. AB3002 TaxID=1392502 RepID=UPI0004969412